MSLPPLPPLPSVPLPELPRRYNAAEDLLDRHRLAGRGDKTAYIDDQHRLSFSELAERASRFGSALLGLGLRPEERIALLLYDSIDWPVAFLGAIRAGIVPVALNTLLSAADYEYMLGDSRARALVVSAALLPTLLPLLPRLPALSHIIVAGDDAPPHMTLAQLLQRGRPDLDAAPTTGDDVCFWLYSSGSTGVPKGTLHVHSTLRLTAELYAKPILGLREDDVVYSAAKLFFAYGLGNALAFPLTVGATTVLRAGRPTPAAVFACLRAERPTVFYGVPTLFAALLAERDFPRRGELALRICTSAGEALPQSLGQRWVERTGVDILDGIGSTEMAHIFLSNRPGEVRYGTTGRVVPGYHLCLLDEAGRQLGPGEIGDLYVAGPTSALGYWNQRERSRGTFLGEWTRTGDKYACDESGYFTYAGRSDDMLKVSGQYVSPVEVEAALGAHPAVLEAAVVGQPDENQLVKPKAFVVLQAGQHGDETLVHALQTHVRARLAPHKYPRWIEFVPELPKTATGKIQRFKLRG